jgi:pimeloyl-ACP methyl ester carboxylesterase
MDYFTFGTGAETFVILPGLSVQSVMDSAEIISRAYDIFAKEYTVYLFDRRSNLPENYSVYEMADDTAEVFKALGLKDIYLFGASQGGMIAFTLAARYPGLVKKLVVGSSSAVVSINQYATIDKWVNLACNKDRVALFIEMCRDIYPAEMFKEYQDTFELIGKSLTEEQMKRFVTLAKGTKNFDITAEMDNIRCPVFSIGATDDAVLPGGAEKIYELLSDKPDFKSYNYTGYGHAVFDTASDFKQKMMDFFNQ